jgi:flagellar basal body-associated protein FliL
MAKVPQTNSKEIKERSKCVPLVLLGLTVLLAGSTACKSSSPTSKDKGPPSHAPQVAAVLHLEPFVVNLADPEENRFLRVGIDLGLETPVTAKGGKGGEGEVPTARIRDCILGVLSTWHSDALLVPEGKQKLKDELVHALRDKAPELGVREIYFNDFLVQR